MIVIIIKEPRFEMMLVSGGLLCEIYLEIFVKNIDVLDDVLVAFVKLLMLSMVANDLRFESATVKPCLLMGFVNGVKPVDNVNMNV